MKYTGASIAKRIITTVFIRGLGAFSIFAMNYIVAKLLPTTDAGNFLWSLSGVLVITQIALLGLHDVALKNISQNSKPEDLYKASAISRTIFKWSGVSLTLTVAVVISFAAIIRHISHSKELLNTIILISPSILFWGMLNILAFKLQALEKVSKSIFSVSIGPYIIFSFLFLIVHPSDAQTAGALFSLATGICLALCHQWWKKEMPNPIHGTVEKDKLINMAKPMWLISIMAISINWGTQFLAGFWVSSSDIAQLSIALRAAALINFLLIAANFIAAPKIASLYKKSNIIEIQKLTTLTVRSLYILSIPLIVFLTLFSTKIMSLFGQNYTDGGHLLLVLSIGQIINLLTGPVGYLLTMTENERAMRNMYIISGSTTIFLSLILIPSIGVLGAAISTSLGLAIQNLGAAWLVNKILGISISPFKSVKA